MSAEVLYRKWRPRGFAEVAGQEAVVRTLMNAVSSGKVAHAYLFSGPRGTGKTTTGRLLARAVNCAKPQHGEPCNECQSCRDLLENRDFEYLIELDAASNRGIDEIRGLRQRSIAGGGGTYKIYLIDEVHMLTEPAFNALLKTLEEPPPHVIFVLATTEAHKVPATVVSRCQRFDFRRIPLSDTVARLAHVAKQEKIDCPADALEVIGRHATGSLRDAINLLEQLVDQYGRKLKLDQVQEGLGLVIDARSAELSARALRGELAEGLALIASVRDDGLDLRQFQRQVVAYLRGLLLVKAEAPNTDDWSDEQLAEMRATVADVPAERIVAVLRAFGEADLRADPLSPLPLELALAGSSIASAEPQEPSAPAPKPPAAREAPAAPAKSAPKRGRPGTRSNPGPAEEPNDTADATPPPEFVAKPAANVPTATLEETRAHWPEIYQRTRALHYRAGALLNSGCAIIGASDDEVVFGFRHSMLLDRMQGDGGENLRALQQAVEEVLGPGRTVRCVLEPNVEAQRPARGGHLVRAAEELSDRLRDD